MSKYGGDLSGELVLILIAVALLPAMTGAINAYLVNNTDATIAIIMPLVPVFIVIALVVGVAKRQGLF